jgi:hypothetical protein
MDINAKDFAGLVKELLCIGCRDLASVVWIQQPVRINGVWHCEVKA